FEVRSKLEVRPHLARDDMPISRTLVPFLLAVLAPIAVYLLIETIRRDIPENIWTFALIVGFVSLVAGLVLVFPVLVFVPRMRQPSPWIAAPWGAVVACCTGTIVSGGRWGMLMNALLGAMGLVAGVVY